MRIRHGRATVTGSAGPGSQELARHEPLQVRDARSRGGSPDGFGSGVVRRLILVRHAPTAATRSYAFPADEPLDQRGIAAATELSAPARAEVVCSPSERCRATAEAAGLTIGSIEPAIAECDFGSWCGRSLDELVAERPADTRRWMADPDSAPHGGESLRAFVARVAGWLDEQARQDGTCLAITHGGVVKAAVVHALGAPIEAFWRVDCAPLARTELHAHQGRWTLTNVNVPVRAVRAATTRRGVAGMSGAALVGGYRGGRGLRRSAPVAPRRGLREGRAGRRARRLCAEPDARRALRVRARGFGGARRRAERPCRPAHCSWDAPASWPWSPGRRSAGGRWRARRAGSPGAWRPGTSTGHARCCPPCAAATPPVSMRRA